MRITSSLKALPTSFAAPGETTGDGQGRLIGDGSRIRPTRRPRRQGGRHLVCWSGIPGASSRPPTLAAYFAYAREPCRDVLAYEGLLQPLQRLAKIFGNSVVGWIAVRLLQGSADFARPEFLARWNSGLIRRIRATTILRHVRCPAIVKLVNLLDSRWFHVSDRRN